MAVKALLKTPLEIQRKVMDKCDVLKKLIPTNEYENIVQFAEQIKADLQNFPELNCQVDLNQIIIEAKKRLQTKSAQVEKNIPAMTKIFSPLELRKVMQSKPNNEIKESEKKLESPLVIPIETEFEEQKSELQEVFPKYELIHVSHPQPNGEIFQYFPYYLARFDPWTHRFHLVLVKMREVPLMIHKEKTIQIDPLDQQIQIFQEYHEFRKFVTNLKGENCDQAIKSLQLELMRLYPEIHIIKTANTFAVEYQNQKYHLNLGGVWWGKFTIQTKKKIRRFIELPGFYSLNLFFANRSTISTLFQKMQLGDTAPIVDPNDQILSIAKREQNCEQIILITVLIDFLLQALAIILKEITLFSITWWILLGLGVIWIINKLLSSFLRSRLLYSEIPPKIKKKTPFNIKFHQWKLQFMQKSKLFSQLKPVDVISQAIGEYDFKNQKISEFLSQK